MAETTTTDDLSIEYETTVFELKPDHIGRNIATLLHARTTNNQSPFYKAILYLHGYSDYFFHDHVSTRFLEHGYDFFALDLRKCGRSILSPEHDNYRHYFRDIREYDEEITLSIDHIIKQAKDQTRKIILYGHSTGGLVASLYAASGPRHKDIHAVILNSPYLTPLDTSIFESILSTVLINLGLSTDIPDNGFGQTIHRSKRGEWNFDTKIKPIDKLRVHGPSFYAIRTAQQELLRQGSCIKNPILFMCSSRSIKPNKVWRDEYTQADLLLNVTTMRQAVATMGSHVTIHEIEHGSHDIFLSKLPVREKAFNLMFRWLKNLEDDWTTTTTSSSN